MSDKKSKQTKFQAAFLNITGLALAALDVGNVIECPWWLIVLPFFGALVVSDVISFSVSASSED